MICAALIRETVEYEVKMEVIDKSENKRLSRKGKEQPQGIKQSRDADLFDDSDEEDFSNIKVHNDGKCSKSR